MATKLNDQNLTQLIKELSSPFTEQTSPIAIILAAGQGKRIKSNHSKMLHTIWGLPTVVRVARAAQQGLESADQIIIVGIKAKDVAEAAGKQPGRRFALQAEQNGTGHAVKVALDSMEKETTDRDIYVIPGDMGLLDTETVRAFKKAFAESGAHMMVMVGNFQGDSKDNYYGRIVQVPETDINGNASGPDKGKIIQITEHKDILAMDPSTPCMVTFKNKTYSFTKKELLETRAYNSGFYAFQGKHLVKLIEKLGYENVQAEMYLTDLIYLFNEAGLSVCGVPAKHEETLLGFNDKAVLAEMHAIARTRTWEKLNKIVAIADKDDFFIADDVVDHLLELDKKGHSHDIAVGEGASIGAGVRLNEGVHIDKHALLEGNVLLGKGVYIGPGAHISVFPGQTLSIGNNTRILQGDTIKGNVSIGSDCLIETEVRITGNDQYPVQIGNNVRIKGMSYLFGCTIESDCFVINCVLRQKKVAAKHDSEGKIIPVCYIFPEPGGKDCVSSLE
ncbi:MAG: NTP transferase domain-containing protein [Spirochaetales bacterium]|nr:NTP transferase domain-containing protein [Spirochaetales bacterium]